MPSAEIKRNLSGAKSLQETLKIEARKLGEENPAVKQSLDKIYDILTKAIMESAWNAARVDGKLDPNLLRTVLSEGTAPYSLTLEQVTAIETECQVLLVQLGFNENLFDFLTQLLEFVNNIGFVPRFEAGVATTPTREAAPTVAKELLSLKESYRYATYFIIFVRKKTGFSGFFTFNSIPAADSPQISTSDPEGSQSSLETFLARLSAGEFGANEEALRAEMLQQIVTITTLILKSKLDEKSKPSSTLGLPGSSWTVADDFVVITGLDPTLKRDFKGIIDLMPTELMPYFNYLKSKVIGMGWTHTMAAQLKDLDSGGKVMADDILKFYGSGNAEESFSAYNLMATLSQEVDGNFEKLGLSRETMQTCSWDLAPLTRLAMSIYDRATLQNPKSSTVVEAGVSIPNAIPLEITNLGGDMYNRIVDIMKVKYRDWLVAVGRKTAGADLTKEEQAIVLLAVRQAFIQQRISLQEVDYDPISQKQELAQWFNARLYYKPDGSKSAHSSVSGKDVAAEAGTIVQRYAVPLGEFLHGLATVPREAFEQSPGYEFGSWEEFLTETKSNNAALSQKRYYAACGMFSENKLPLLPDGSVNYRELEKTAVLLRVKPEYRIMGDTEPDVPYVMVHRSALRPVAGSNYLQLHLNLNALSYELRLNEHHPRTQQKMIHFDSVIADAEKSYKGMMDLAKKWHDLSKVDKGEPIKPISKIKKLEVLRLESEFSSRFTSDVRRMLIGWGEGLELIPPIARIYDSVLGRLKLGAENEDIDRVAEAVFNEAYRQFVVPSAHIGTDVLEEWDVRDFFEKGVKYFYNQILLGNSPSEAYVDDASGELKVKTARSGHEFRDTTVLRNIFREAGRTMGSRSGVFLPPLYDHWLTQMENSGTNKDARAEADLGIMIEMMMEAFALDLNKYALIELPPEAKLSDYRSLRIHTASDEVDPMSILDVVLYERLAVAFITNVIIETLYKDSSGSSRRIDRKAAEADPKVQRMRQVYSDENIRARLHIHMHRLGIIKSKESTVYMLQKHDALRSTKTVEKYVSDQTEDTKK